MILPWKKLSERVEKVGWRTILHRVFAHPSGKEVECTIVDGGEGVVIIAMTPNGDFVMCRNFRPGPERVFLDLPAGRVEEGEDVMAAAERELKEETGYFGKVEYVGKFDFWGWGKGTRHVCVIHGAVLAGPQQLDGFEVIEPVLVSLDEFLILLRGGKFPHVGEAYMALYHLGIVKIPDPEFRRIVCCLLSDGNRFLLQRRSDDAPRYPGKWGIFGGRLEEGEVPLEAVKREFLEELRYNLGDPRLLFVHQSDEVELSLFSEEYDHIQELDQQEGQDMQWCTLEEALSLDLCDIDRTVLERLRTVWHDAPKD